VNLFVEGGAGGPCDHVDEGAQGCRDLPVARDIENIPRSMATRSSRMAEQLLPEAAERLGQSFDGVGDAQTVYGPREQPLWDRRHHWPFDELLCVGLWFRSNGHNPILLPSGRRRY